MKHSTALLPSYSNTIFSDWQNVLERNELCSVLVPPISGYEYRISNFLEWQEKNNLECCKVIHLFVDKVSDPEVVESIFKSTNKPLIIYPGKHLLDNENFSILSAILELRQQYNHSVLIFFEATLSELEQLPLHISHTVLQNIRYIPLLSFENTQQFCLHIAERWKLQISQADINTIYEYTGGQMWLIKETLRQIAKNDINTVKNFYL